MAGDGRVREGSGGTAGGIGVLRPFMTRVLAVAAVLVLVAAALLTLHGSPVFAQEHEDEDEEGWEVVEEYPEPPGAPELPHTGGSHLVLYISGAAGLGGGLWLRRRIYTL